MTAPTGRQTKSGAGDQTQAGPPRSNHAIASFVLSPELLRDSDKAQKLSIPAGATSVQLQLELRNSRARHFRTTLQSGSGSQVWSPSDARVRRTSYGPIVVLNIPAAIFREPDYMLKLSNGKPEDPVYYFRVERK